MFSAIRVAGLAAALLAGVSGAALAQQAQPRPRTPAPTPAHAQPAPAQPAPAQPGAPQGQQAQPTGPLIVQVKPEPSQAEWTKVCGKDPSGQSEICYTTRDFVSDQGQPVLAAAIYDVKGGSQPKVVRFLMPLGLLLRPGIRFAVDQGPASAGAYTICFPNGCFAETVGLKDELLASMKKGTNINVSVQNQVGREVTFQVPLAGFGKAFDGAPIDPKVLEEQQKRLQDELEKRSEDLRKRLEQGQAGAGTTPPAVPPKP